METKKQIALCIIGNAGLLIVLMIAAILLYINELPQSTTVMEIFVGFATLELVLVLCFCCVPESRRDYINRIEREQLMELPQIVSSAPVDPSPVEQNDDESCENVTSNQSQADSLPLYLIIPPVVHGQLLKFKEQIDRDILKDVLLPWYNTLRLLAQSCDQLKIDKRVTFIYKTRRLYSSMSLNANVMDRWIVSYTQTLLDFVEQEMKDYRPDTVVPRLVKYIDMLTNWYVKLNKKRIKGETVLKDCIVSLNVLCYTLLIIVKLMVPFTPFLAEFMYRVLRKSMPKSSSAFSQRDFSVYFQMIPKSQESLVNKDIERAVSAVQTVIRLGRVARERKLVPMKYPLPEFVIMHKDESVLNDIQSLTYFVREGLNVRKVTLSQERELYGVEVRAEPNISSLGKKAGGKTKTVTQKIRDISDTDVEEMLSKGEGESPLTVIDDVPIESEDIHIVYRVAKQTRFEAIAKQGFVVLLDYTADATLVDEGLIHEITSRVQKLRKEAKLIHTDDITVYCSVKPSTSEIARVAVEQKDKIKAILKKPFVPLSNLSNQQDSNVVITKKFPIKDSELEFVISRNAK